MTDYSGYKGKKLLFIGASGHFELAIKKAKSMGIHTIIINYNSNAMAKQYADEAYDVDTYNHEEVLDFARKKNIDGIFTSWNEFNLFTSAYVSREMDIPFFATKQQLEQLVTKDAFKKTCKRYGVPVVPEYYIGGNKQDFLETEMEYPVIVKPTDSGGTRGMTVLYNGDSLQEAYEKAQEASTKKEIVAEKYIKNGQLIVIDFAIQNGRVYIASVADRSIVRTSDTAVPLAISYMYPSKYIEPVKQQIYEPVCRLLEGLDIKNGIISFEAIVSNEKIYLIETQFRFGGTHFYKFVEKDCGVDLLEMMIEYAIKGTYETYSFEGVVKPEFEGTYACQNLQVDTGKIISVEGIDDVRKITGVDWFIQIKNMGDKVPDDGSTAQNFAKIGLSAKSDRELYQIMDKIQHTLKVLDENGHNLVRQNIPQEYLM